MIASSISSSWFLTFVSAKFFVASNSGASDFLYFILLGAIQGVTEFLPISSSGHLVLLENVLGFNPPGVVTEIALHLATLFAVVIYYFKDISALLTLKSSPSLSAPKAYLARLVVITLVTAILIYPFREAISSMTEDSLAIMRVALAFLVTSLILFSTDILLQRGELGLNEASSLGLLAVIFIGIVQAVSAIPGISRSGSTIFAGILCGLKREESARLSFFMFVAIALLASLYEAYRQSSAISLPPQMFLPLITGFLTALIAGILSIHFLLGLLKRARLKYFSVYLIVIGVISLTLL